LENSQMKKTLIAMAAVAVAGVASAQVTITGKIGFGVKDSTTSAKTMDWTDGAVTFAASEDLGGGLTAAASMAIGNLTSHQGTVDGDGASISLSGGFGKIHYASGASAADRLGVASGLAISAGTAAVFGADVDSAAQFNYTLPEFVPGLSVTARISNTSGDEIGLTNKDAQLRLAYTTGALGVTYNTIGGTSPATDMGVTYDAGFAKFAYAADVSGTYAATVARKRSEFSVSVPMGALTLAASTGTRQGSSDGSTLVRAKANEFNASYALSKRTTVNAAYGSFTTNAGASQSANTIKVVHTF
jgi:predicted porin